MAVEIERKFLIHKDRLPALPIGKRLKQGYIESAPGKVVRIRTSDDDAFLTLKGKTEGFSRLEYEYSIPYTDAVEILDKLCSKPIISKTRYEIMHEGKKWELDVFELENRGLIVAEIELSSETESFALPSWVGKEVSDLKQYRNNYLAEHPFITWASEQ
jgi:adenylate cyclase